MVQPALRIELCLDCRDPGVVRAFWRQALGWREQPNTYGDPELVSSDGNVTMWFQPVPEDKVVKNRLHLDVYSHHLAETVAELEGIGATRVGDVVPESVRFQVMLDPEGNEFCVCREYRTGSAQQ
jgi:predicted enzyme related to lactoylglutathione lyase